MDWDDIVALPEGATRTAALTEWVQDLFRAGRKPTLVGGAAVELFTGGAYTTGDLDLVGEPDDSVAAALMMAGFQKKGRHWIHEEAQVFLEFPSSGLDPGEQSAMFRLGQHRVLILRLEDLIAERLAQWMHWSEVREGVNAYLLVLAHRDEVDWNRLRERARAYEAEPAFERLAKLLRAKAGPPLDDASLEAWAKEFPRR